MKKLAISSMLALLTIFVTVGPNVAMVDDKYVASPTDEQLLGTWKMGRFNEGTSVTLTLMPHEKEGKFDYDIEINWGGRISRGSSKWGGGKKIELKDGTITYRGKTCMYAELRLTKDLQTLEGTYENNCRRISGAWKLVKQN